MIIVDSNSLVWEALEKHGLDKDLSCVKLDVPTYELSNGLDDELILVHESAFNSEAAKAKLSRAAAVIVFGNTGNHYELNSIVALIDGNTNFKVLSNLIGKFESIVREQQVLKSQLMTINRDISEIVGDVEVELLKVKHLYELKAPKRIQKFNGLQVFSKYSAGENLGGEFFDVYKKDQDLIILMSSTNSYLISSSILNLFSNFRDHGNTNMNSLFADIVSDALKVNETKNKSVELEINLLKVNLSDLSVKGYLVGNFGIVSSDLKNLYSNKKTLDLVSPDLENYEFETQLERGKRYLLTSPGFNKNWQKEEPGFLQEELLFNKSIKTLDILDEAYFQLKKNLRSDFLPFDASSLVLEVDKNVLHKA